MFVDVNDDPVSITRHVLHLEPHLDTLNSVVGSWRYSMNNLFGPFVFEAGLLICCRVSFLICLSKLEV